MGCGNSKKSEPASAVPASNSSKENQRIKKAPLQHTDPGAQETDKKASVQESSVKNGGTTKQLTQDKQPGRNTDPKQGQPPGTSTGDTEASSKSDANAPQTQASKEGFIDKAQDDLAKLAEMAKNLENQILAQMTAITQNLALQKSPAYVDKIIRGDLEAHCPSEARVVRIFVSSTFTDTRHERNWLMEKVFPRLKNFCQNNSYDFQVVDMRWGIRDEAQDDHMTTDICLKEVELCKQQSTGPFFMSLMSHKYGYRDFPRSIEASEFEALCSSVEDQDVKQMLLRWFQRDDNSVPQSYVLQPISSILPDTKSDIREIKNDAWKSWTSQSSTMHSALSTAAKTSLDVSRHNSYEQSVSEAEVGSALSGVDSQRLVWFRRIITDIEKVDVEKERDILRRYRDLTQDPLKDEESKRLLERLEEKTLKDNIPNANIFTYKVQWQPNRGIDPEVNPDHAKYLLKLCHDAEQHLVTSCKNAFSQRHQIATRDPLFLEVLQHVNFCHDKCKAFHGRSDSLKKIVDYLSGPSKYPFIIHGPSGCGKTSIVAMAAQLAQSTIGDKGILCIRFIATTPNSTTITSLLSSLITQLTRAAKLPKPQQPALTLRSLVLRFHAQLIRISKTRPLVLLLDSLDQLDPSNDARHLAWLPATLPVNCKVILSTLPEPQYESFPYLQAKFKDMPENFMEVPELNFDDISGILDKWLDAAGRSLTNHQRSLVLNTFQKCPLPLFLRLAFDEATKWKSYTPVELCVLETTVRACINRLLSQMEVAHGKVFVSRALGYLTVSQSGLSDVELEDILACDEQVLGDVYRFWTPPVRRLPPLLLVRVKRDLGHYVVERGASGKQVFFWYHRQFIEAATERYCSVPDVVTELHKGLADFFAGTWAGTPMPYVDKDGKEHTADRLVAEQPVKLGESFNSRKLANQAYHRVKAGQLDKVKSECLLNYDFLMGKLRCFGIRSILDDFIEARQAFPDDASLRDVAEVLQLSQNAIAYDVRLFSSQMTGRIGSSKLPDVSVLLEQCRHPDHMFLEPNRPLLKRIGGTLLHSIAEHSDTISAMVVNREGTVAATSEERGTIKTYDVTAGKVLRTIPGAGKDPDKMRLANNDTTLIVKSTGKLSAYDLMTGAKKWLVDFPKQNSQFMMGGPDFSRVLVIRGRTLTFLDADTGKQLKDVCELPETIPQTVKFDTMTPIAGCETYMVTVEYDQKGVFVFDAINMNLSHFKKVLKSYKDENNDKVDGTVDGLEISHDGSTLYMANYSDNDLHIVDTATLEIKQVYQGCKHDFSEKYHLSNDGKYIYFSNSEFIRVWDLATGKKATVLHGEADQMNIEDVYTSDMNTFVTFNSDKTLKIWDLSRSSNPTIDFQDLPRDFKIEKKKAKDLRDLVQMEGSRYYMAEHIDGKTQYIGVFDTSNQSMVCQTKWTFEDSDTRMSYVHYMGDWKISFESNRRCRVLDLRTMEVSCVVQGQAPQYSSECYPVNGGKELATLTRGRMNVKLVDINSGKIVSILKAGQKNRIDTIVTNKTGTKVIVDCEGPFLVFDVVNRCLELEITAQMVQQKDELYLSDPLITDDGKYFIFSAEYKIPKEKLSPGVKVESTTSIFVFNLATKSLEHVLVDIERYTSLKLVPSGDMTVSVDGCQFLDDTRLVSTHDDFQVRVWNFKLGTLLKRLQGHTSYNQVNYMLGSPLLVTNGSWDEEFTIRVWDVNTWECVALYRYETDINEVKQVSPTSSTLIGRLKNDEKPLFFKLKGQGSEKYETKGKAEPTVDFKKGEFVLDLSHPSDATIDEDNPDSDPEEVDDDDDDDDDTDFSEEKISDDEDWLNK